LIDRIRGGLGVDVSDVGFQVFKSSESVQHFFKNDSSQQLCEPFQVFSKMKRRNGAINYVPFKDFSNCWRLTVSRSINSSDLGACLFRSEPSTETISWWSDIPYKLHEDSFLDGTYTCFFCWKGLLAWSLIGGWHHLRTGTPDHPRLY
jgi:hypothetical protein